MTVQEFFDKYLNKFIDFDGWYGAQCVDLIQQYNKEVYNGPFLTGAGAVNIWDTYPTDFYDRVLNTPTAIPQLGDIVIWNTGQFGHIAIFKEGSVKAFTSFDQNYPTGSACHFQDHDYTGVIGWLTPINKPEDTILVLKTDFERLVRKSTSWDKVCQKLNVADNEQIVLAELDKLISYEDSVVQKDKQLTDANAKITDLQKQFDDLTTQKQKLETDNADLVKNVAEQTSTIEEYDTELKVAQASLQNITDQLQKPILSGWKLFIYKLLIGR